MKLMIRYLGLALAFLLCALLLLVAFAIAPVDRTHVSSFGAFDSMNARIKNLDTVQITYGDFQVGFATANITPSFRVATAGYGNRKGKLFTSVHDSIYVRTLIISNGRKKVAIVSADLLIIPPVVTQQLATELPKIGFTIDNVYLGATHTHNSIGGWGEGATRFIYGSYDDNIVRLITDGIISSIRNAAANIAPAEIKSGKISVPQVVYNRLIDGGPEDTSIRVVEIERIDEKKMVLMSFTAHATCLFSRNLEISRDYPGKLVDTLEAQGYDFAMFMAGSVGSHSCSPPSFGWECLDWMAGEISREFFSQYGNLDVVNDSALQMIRVPLALSDPQVKISREWKVRSWLFRSAFGEYPVALTGMRLGDIAFVGVPADLSGEFNRGLDSVGTSVGLSVIPTSFNGGYIGYLTPIERYDMNHYETQLMNWYAPGTGDHVALSLQEIIKALK